MWVGCLIHIGLVDDDDLVGEAGRDVAARDTKTIGPITSRPSREPTRAVTI
jgi:hypothetical protein